MSSSSKQKDSAEAGIQAAGKQVTAASQMTPEETKQYTGSFDIGNLLKQIMEYQQGLGQAPSGFQTGEQQFQGQGPVAQQYYQQTLRGMQDPYGTYESTLQPQLKLAENYINQQAAGRGLLRSGIPIEQLGLAGVNLAVSEAAQRMQYRNQQLASGGQLAQYAQGYGQQNLQNLQNLYGQQQQTGLQASGRQAQGAQAAAPYYAAPAQAQLGSYYGGQAAMQALPGQLLGAAGTLGAAYLGQPKNTINLGSSFFG